MGDEHRSLDRVRRMFGRFIGVGYGIYLVISLPNIVTSAEYADRWWTPVAAVLVFGSGIGIGLSTFLPNPTWMMYSTCAAAMTYLAAALSYFLVWNGIQFQGVSAFWLAAFPAVPALAAATTWPPWLAFTNLVCAVTAVQTISYTIRDPLITSPLVPDVVFSLMFCGIFVAAALAGIRTAKVLDSTIAGAHTVAATAAAADARAVERERFDALIHDGVISTLLSVTRQGRTPSVARSAVLTMEQLDALRAGNPQATEFDTDGAVAHIRAAATEVDEGISVDVTAAPSQEYPAEVVRAISSALAEALRNSILHAGPHTQRGVRVTAGPDEVEVVVTDNGRGFVPSAVPPQRMGVAVSIYGRMSQVRGGRATIDTAAGSGTTVRLGWRK